jgi:hypothetical protein
MSEKFDDALVEVWKQSLVEDKSAVTLHGRNFAVTATVKKRLKQVEFEIEGRRIRGIEQNPATKSRWAKMAKSGKRVMQFIENGTYVAVVVEGKVYSYGKERRTEGF